MSNFAYYAMPTYSRNHEDFCKQMYEWHLKMHNYREQQKTYHLEQARHFQKFIGEKANVSGISDNNSVA